MQDLSPSSSFTVKQSPVVLLVVAAVFYAMFFSAFDYNSGAVFGKMMMMSFIPALICTIAAFKRTAIISINRKGIWFSRVLVCTWQNFISARVHQEDLKTGGWTDQVFLSIEFFRGTGGDVFRKTMQLINSEDKSEEEIIAAIEYFHELYKQKAGEEKK